MSTQAERRRWHIDFTQRMGRAQTLINDRDHDEVRAMRAEGKTPEQASVAMLNRLADRHGERFRP